MESKSRQVIAESTTGVEREDSGSRMWELIPNPIMRSPRAPAASRLNLIIPWLSRKRITGGGPATAVRLFQRLAAEFPTARIIVTHESASDLDFADWPRWVLDEGQGATRSIVFLGDRKTPLTVAAEDYFIATFWSTAVYVKDVIEQQAQFHAMPKRRFVYLIQDYEPGFYAWSARFAYAASTYRDLNGVIAVFNTSLLAGYFNQNGLRFKEQYVFEPMLHPHLRKKRADPRAPTKERLMLVYGRPSVPRNDFEFVVDTLRIWAREYPAAKEWTVVSGGESHPDVALGRGAVLRSGGQMSLDQYADHLCRCWVGLSYMFSAHPSYPPLEMAEFGAWVVTNRFANKDPSLLAPSIIGVDEIRPDEAARKLVWCCQQFEVGRRFALPNVGSLFRPEGDEFPFARSLGKSWLESEQGHTAHAEYPASVS